MKNHDDLNKLLKKTLRKAEKEKWVSVPSSHMLDIDASFHSQRAAEGENEKILSPKRSKKLAMAYVALGRDYLQR